MTEPLKGSLHESHGEVEGLEEYVPTSHVKFLEQAGIKVIPISYKTSEEELMKLLDKVNGIYFHGDSHKSFKNDQFQSTVKNILLYVKN